MTALKLIKIYEKSEWKFIFIRYQQHNNFYWFYTIVIRFCIKCVFKNLLKCLSFVSISLLLALSIAL